ncbi:MAG: ABC transporter ATP-binding protein, partial [Kiritimatiellae bacterium]|nr:ABC transporter ATP-binding protein [Kiritimatiellia bacterium]
LQLQTVDARRAAAVLRNELPESSVGLFGDRIHVATRDLDATQKKAEAILRSARIEVSCARPVPPTLEDVFVSVLADKEGGDHHE